MSKAAAIVAEVHYYGLNPTLPRQAMIIIKQVKYNEHRLRIALLLATSLPLTSMRSKSLGAAGWQGGVATFRSLN